MHPNFREYSDERVDAAVMQALKEVDLPPSYRISIRSLVRSQAQNWRTCCGGNCNPCIGRIEEAVDRARQLLVSMAEPLQEPTPEPSPSPDPGAEHGSRGHSAPVSDERRPIPDDESEERNWGMDYA